MAKNNCAASLVILIGILFIPWRCPASEDMSSAEIEQQISCLENGGGESCYDNHIESWKQKRHDEWFAGVLPALSADKALVVPKKIPFTKVYQFTMRGQFDGSRLYYFVENGLPWGIAAELTGGGNGISTLQNVKTQRRESDPVDYTQRHGAKTLRLERAWFSLKTRISDAPFFGCDRKNEIIFMLKESHGETGTTTTVEYLPLKDFATGVSQALERNDAGPFVNRPIPAHERKLLSFCFPEKTFKQLTSSPCSCRDTAKTIARAVLPEKKFQYYLVDLPQKQIQAALENAVASHLAGKIFAGKNYFSATWDVAWENIRDAELTKLFQLTCLGGPNVDPEFLAEVVGHIFDNGNINPEDITEIELRQRIKKNIKKYAPELTASANLADFLYMVTKKRLKAE